MAQSDAEFFLSGLSIYQTANCMKRPVDVSLELSEERIGDVIGEEKGKDTLELQTGTGLEASVENVILIRMVVN